MQPDSTPPAISWGRVAKRTIKPILILVVVAGIGQAVRLAYLDLHHTQAKAEQRIATLDEARLAAAPDEAKRLDAEIDAVRKSLFSFAKVHWWLVAGAVPFACSSIFPPGTFWWLTIKQFGHAVPYLPTQSAYAVGGLGKYVPGKAMVLILRSASMQKWGVPIATSILAIFIETLMALAAGGGIGTLALTSLTIPRWLRVALIATAAISLFPILPPVFRRIVVLLSRSRHLRLPARISEAMTWRFVAVGWLLSVAGQLLMGMALWMICLAVFDPEATTLVANVATNGKDAWYAMKLLPVCFAATSMGFVIGFLSMLPGGAGARELVVTVVLAPVIGYAPALAAAVLFRIANLIGDLATAGTLAWRGKSMSRQST